MPTPNPAAETATDVTPEADDLADGASIIDTILKLDELLSADVRRARRSAKIYTRPDLEAVIDRLHVELSEVVDPDTGQPLKDLALNQRPAAVVNAELRTTQQAYQASGKNVEFEQMPDDDWTTFCETHKEAFDAHIPGNALPVEVANRLIAASMCTEPRATPEKVATLRGKLGKPAMKILADVALDVNDRSGVDVPFSRLSSAVTRLLALEQS